MNITDSQIFSILFVRLFTGVLALRLGAELYKLVPLKLRRIFWVKILTQKLFS
nr:M polypeptide of photosystem I [Dinophyceae sp. MRD-151]